MKKIYLLMALLATAVVGCKPTTETEPEEPVGATVVYSVSIVSAAGTTIAGRGNRASTLSDVDVFATNADGSVIKTTTDESGLAVMKLPAGIANIVVRAQGYTTLNYIVDLGAVTDTATHNNIGNVRSAASIVRLYATDGSGTITVSGKVYVDINKDNPGNETPTKTPLTVNAYIRPSISSFNHTGAGRILSAVYESANFSAPIQIGDYSINVPSSSDGVNVTLVASEFADFIITGGNPQANPTNFFAPSFDLVAKTGGPVKHDFTYLP